MPPLRFLDHATGLQPLEASVDLGPPCWLQARNQLISLEGTNRQELGDPGFKWNGRLRLLCTNQGEPCAQTGEVQPTWSRMVAYDGPFRKPLFIVRFFRGSEEKLCRRIAEERATSANAVLRTFEAIVGAGFGRMVRPEQGHPMLHAPAVDTNQGRRIEMVIVGIDTSKDEEGVHNHQVGWHQAFQQIEQDTAGV